jgi:hypothetical protein
VRHSRINDRGAWRLDLTGKGKLVAMASNLAPSTVNFSAGADKWSNRGVARALGERKERGGRRDGGGDRQLLKGHRGR